MLYCFKRWYCGRQSEIKNRFSEICKQTKALYRTRQSYIETSGVVLNYLRMKTCLMKGIY